jgi:hypothetical protein
MSFQTCDALHVVDACVHHQMPWLEVWDTHMLLYLHLMLAGDLVAAVASGNLSGLQRLLAASHNTAKQQQQQLHEALQHHHQQQQQQQLEIALELAALLGQSRLALAKLLLLHGADPCSRSGAALAWAARRRR